jgi:ferric iron reductase protein FhuF
VRARCTRRPSTIGRRICCSWSRLPTPRSCGTSTC